MLEDTKEVLLYLLTQPCHVSRLIKADGPDFVTGIAISLSDSLPVFNPFLVVEDDLRNVREHGQKILCVCSCYADRSRKAAIHVVILYMADTSDAENFLLLCHARDIQVEFLLKGFDSLKVSYFVEVLSKDEAERCILQEVEYGRIDRLLSRSHTTGIVRQQLLRNNQKVRFPIMELRKGRKFSHEMTWSQLTASEGIPQVIWKFPSFQFSDDVA